MATERWRINNIDKMRKYRRDYYAKNRKSNILRTKERREKLKKWLIDYKSNLKCIICSEDEICCIEFHHNDPRRKENTISRAIHNGWSINKLLLEIEKCYIYCANCHRKIHNGVIKPVV